MNLLVLGVLISKIFHAHTETRKKIVMKAFIGDSIAGGAHRLPETKKAKNLKLLEASFQHALAVSII